MRWTKDDWQLLAAVLLIAGLALWVTGAVWPVIACVAVAGVVLYASRLQAPASTLVARIFGVFFPLLIVWLAAVYFIVTVLPAELKPVKPALVIGTGVAFGWIVTFLSSEYQRLTVSEDTRRDTLVALRSEVLSIVYRLDLRPINADAADQQRKIIDEDKSLWPKKYYHPFPTSERAPIIFDSVGGSIPLFQPTTVKRVVRFYSAYADLRDIVEDFRSNEVKALSATRRAAIHGEMTSRRTEVLRLGIQAAEAIETELGNPSYTVERSGKNNDIIPAPHSQGK